MGKITDEIKNQAKNKAKQLTKKVMMKLLPYIVGFLLIVALGGVLLGIFDAITQKVAELLAEIGDFATDLWVWITDDYWVDIDEEITLTSEDGTQKTKTLVDHYLEQMEEMGISLKDLRILGEADYSNPEVLNDPANKILIQKYLSEFVRADIISQEIHRQNRGDELVNPDDESEVDGGVYLYRTKNEITKEGVVGVDSTTFERMEFKEYEDFKEYATKTNPDYNTAKKMFTIDKETNELLYYKVDETYTGVDVADTGDSSKEYTREYNTEVTLEEKREDYRTLIGKYAMPYEFLINLCMVTQNPEFVYHVAYLARDTHIELIILDSIVEETTEEQVIAAEEKWYRQQIEPEVGETEELYTFQDVEIEYRVTTKKIDTPVLKVGKVNTWSYGMLNKYTNVINENVREDTGTEPDRVNSSEERVSGLSAEDIVYKNTTKLTGITTKQIITTKSNEYREAIIIDETKKSKQFLGLLRNDTGKCLDENDVQNCVDGAEFNRNGYNVKYKIPNSTEEEMPLSKLVSGKQMLFQLLETNRTIETENGEQKLSNYNQKMQGLKEYMQYIMTFPENEWFDLDDDDMDDLLEDDDYDDATYGIFWWPLDPNADCRITSYFGKRKAPLEGASTYHEGIDIGVVTGTDVLASADGVVEFAGGNPDTGYGYYITIDHQNRI